MNQFEISHQVAGYMIAVGLGLIVTSVLLPCITMDDFWRAIALSLSGCMLCGGGILAPFKRALLGAILGFFFAAFIAALIIFALLRAANGG